ncbi:MAG: uroporphyrinogen-III synthase [Aliidongia sp.]
MPWATARPRLLARPASPRFASAEGDVEALARLIERERKPEDGALLHISGAVRAGNLAEVLSAKGYSVQHVALYEAVAASALGAETRSAIGDGSLDGVLLFSPRTAKHFAELVAAAGLVEETRRLQAWCLSRAVAEALAPLPLAALHVAPEPTQASLLDTLGDAAAAPVPVTPPIAQPAKPAPERRGGRSWVGLAALLLLAIAAAATAPQWLPLVEPLWQKPKPQQAAEAPPPVTVPETPPSPAPTSPAVDTPTAAPVPNPTPPPSESETAAPDQRLDKIEATLDEIRVAAASAAPKGDVTELQGPPAEALTARPTIDPKQLQDLTTDDKRLAAAMAQLSDRLTPLEARINQRAATIRNDRTLVLAIGQIRDALAGSGSFTAPVAVIKAVAPDDGELSGPARILESHAKSGVPSRVRLAQDLAALPGKLALPRAAGARCRHLGPRDRQGEPSGHDPPGRRRQRHHAGRPGPPRRRGRAGAGRGRSGRRAAACVQQLDGNAATAAKPWIDAAQARIDCEQAVQALDAAGDQTVSAPGRMAERPSDPSPARADRDRPAGGDHGLLRRPAGRRLGRLARLAYRHAGGAADAGARRDRVSCSGCCTGRSPGCSARPAEWRVPGATSSGCRAIAC